MQTEKAKELATVLTASINLYDRYLDEKIEIGPSEKKFQSYFVPSTFEESYQAFLEELRENINEYQDIRIISAYIISQFEGFGHYCLYGIGDNITIIKKGKEMNFLLILKKQIEIHLEKIDALCGKNYDSNKPSNALIEIYNNMALGTDDAPTLMPYIDLSEITEEDEKIEASAPKFDERFDFEKVKKERDQLTGTLAKITFIKDRLYDLQQWQLQYDEMDRGYEEGYSPNSFYIYSERYYPNFENLCDLELKRLNERLDLEMKYGKELTNGKETECVSVHYLWQASDTDLLELVTALYIEKAIQRKDGKEMTRKELLSCFESLFGIEIKNAESKLAKATERKGNPTIFLSKLQNAFKNYTEEKSDKK
jgi:hypothetical protein